MWSSGKDEIRVTGRKPIMKGLVCQLKEYFYSDSNLFKIT